MRAYAQAFPVAYRDDVTPRSAVRDIAFVEKLGPASPYLVSLYRPVESDERTLRLRVFRLGASVPLSSSLPVLENMGLEVLDEVSYEIDRGAAKEGESATPFSCNFACAARGRLPCRGDPFPSPRMRCCPRAPEIGNDGSTASRVRGDAADDSVVLRAYAYLNRRVTFQPDLHRSDSRRASRDRGQAGGALPRALRSRALRAPRRIAEGAD